MLREGNLRLGTLHKQLDEAVKAGASDEAGRLSMEIRELNEKNSKTALMIEIREANNKRLSSEKQEKRRERRRKKMLVEQSIKAGNKLKKLNKGIRKASTTIRKVNEKNSKKAATMAEIRRDNSEQMRSEQQPALLRETEVEHLVNRLVEKKIEQLKSEGRLEKKTGGNAQIAVKTEPQFDGQYGCQ